MYSIQRALFVVVIVLMCDRSFSDRYIMSMLRRQELFFRPYFLLSPCSLIDNLSVYRYVTLRPHRFRYARHKHVCRSC